MRVDELKVSVIIPTYNRGRYLIKVLEQLFFQSRPADEILVIDQTPEQDIDIEVKESLGRFIKEKKIKLFHQDIPNLPMARNRGIKESKTDVLIFIDDDVSIKKDFIERHLVNYMDESIVGVAGQMLTRENPSSVDKIPVKRASHPLDWLSFPYNFAFRMETIFMFGANFSVRRQAALEVKGFDANFIAAAEAEDNDFSWRLHRSGGRVVYEPSAGVFNLAPADGGCRFFSGANPRSVMLRWQNTFYFYLKDTFRVYPFRTTRLILGYLYRRFSKGWNRRKPGFLILTFLIFHCALFRVVFLLIKGPSMLDSRE